jgi:outer membrane protein TolC
MTVWIFLHDVRPIFLPQNPSGYRVVPARHTEQALPCRDTQSYHEVGNEILATKTRKLCKEMSCYGFCRLCMHVIIGYFQCPRCVERTDTLEEAYTCALKTHERIVIAEEEVEKSRLLPQKALTIMFPNVYLDGDYTRLDDEITHSTEPELEGAVGGEAITLGPISVVPKRQRTANLGVKQSIYDGSFFPRRRQAFRTIDCSVESYYEAMQSILFEVATVYYRLIQAREMLRNAKEILKSAEEELRVSTVRFKTGDATEDVVLKSELNVAVAQRKIIENSNNLQLAKGNLTRLTGMQLAGYDLSAPSILPVPGENCESLTSKALEHRHDYKVAQLSVELAEADVDLVKARFHPEVNGT